MIEFEPKYPSYHNLKHKTNELVNDVLKELKSKDDIIINYKENIELLERKLYLANDDITKLRKELTDLKLIMLDLTQKENFNENSN